MGLNRYHFTLDRRKKGLHVVLVDLVGARDDAATEAPAGAIEAERGRADRDA